MPIQREPKILPFTSSTPADISAAKIPPQMFKSAAQTTSGFSLLYQTGLHVFSAEPGTGKSMVTLWCAHEHIKASPDNQVLLIDFEMSSVVVARRMMQFGADPQTWPKQLFEYRPSEDPQFGAGDTVEKRVTQFFVDLIHTVKASGWNNPLIILDGVANALSSFGLNEIDNADVALWNSAIGAVAPALQCPVLTVDHQAKGSSVHSESTLRRPGASRGASAKGAQADVVYSMYDVKDHWPGKGRAGKVKLKCEKDRHSSIDISAEGLDIKFTPVDRQYHLAHDGGVEITFDDSPAIGLAFHKFTLILDAIGEKGGSATGTDIRKHKDERGKRLFNENKTQELNDHLAAGVDTGLLINKGARYEVGNRDQLSAAAELLAINEKAAESVSFKQQQDDDAF